MGKDSGSVDTSGMQAAMQQQNQISQAQMDLAKQMFSYGTERTAKYADPVLQEFQRIMGFAPSLTPQPQQVPGGWLTGLPTGGGQVQVGTVGGMPLYESNGNLFTQTPGMPATSGTPTQQYIDPSTGQLYGSDIPGSQPTGTDLFVSPTNRYDPGGNLIADKGTRLTPYGTPQNAGIGAMVPWSGDPSQVTWGSGINFSATRPQVNRYVSPTESAMNQLPVATSQAQLNQTIQQIKRSTPPGPQQNALIAQARNQMNQQLGQNAFGQVNNMLNSLLATSGAAQAGMQQASGAMSAASASSAAAGNMATTIANLQAQAAQSNNSLLSGVFSTIGSLGGLLGGMSFGGGSTAFSVGGGLAPILAAF